MLLILLLFLFCAASGFWAYSDFLFRSGIIALAQTMALLLIADVFIDNKAEIDLLTRAFVVGTLALSALIGLEYLAGTTYLGADQDLGQEERYSLGSADPNIKAMQLSIGIALLLGHAPLTKNLYANYGLAALLFLGVVLTGSRTGFLAAAATLSVYVLYQANWKVSMLRWVVLASCFVAIYMFWDFQHSEISVERMEKMLEDGTGTDIGGRDIIWQNVVTAFSSHQLLGVGYNSFLDYHKAYFGWNLVAHNTHLNFLVETGIIGYLLFCLVYLQLPLNWLRLTDVDTKRTYLAVFLTLMLCSMTLNLAQHFSFWIFLILLERTAALSTKPESGHQAHRNPELEARLQAIRRPDPEEQAEPA